MNYASLRTLVVSGFVLLFTHLIALGAESGGTVEGRVLLRSAGTYLNRAQIRAEGTTVETYTNDIGEYRLAGLPAGPVTLLVSYVDMRSERATVTVEMGKVIRQDFALTLSNEGTAPTRRNDEPLRLDAFSVSERAMSAEAAAVQEKKAAPNQKNVIAFEEFGDLGEGNPGEFLKFVPGIEINQAPVVPSAASIRGMPSSGTLMLFDGVSMAGSSADVRGADLIGANIGNIERIEVTKVPTPDAPANAVGGTVNVIPKSNLSLTRRALTYNVFATQTTTDSLRRLGQHLGRGVGTAYKNSDRSVTQPGFDATYMLPISPSFAVSLSAGYSDRVELRDILTATWNLANNTQTASGRNPLIIPRERRLLSGTADFKAGPSHRFSFSLQYTDDHAYSQLPAQAYTYGSGTTGDANYSQGPANANGSITQTIGLYNQMRQSISGKAAYVYTGPTWRANFVAGISRSQFNTRTLEDENFRSVTATLSGLVLRADNLQAVSEQRPPVITARNAAGALVDTNNINLYSLGTATGVTIPLMANQQVAKADVARDFDLGVPVTLKTGLSYDHTGRDIRNQTWSWAISPPTSAGGKLVGNYDLVDTGFTARSTFMDGSRIQWMEARKVYRLFKEHPEYFVLNESSAYISGVNGSKLLDEAISAAYVRADARFFNNRLRVTTGVRYERTEDDGRGPLNDPNAIYQRAANGTLLRGSNGKPIAVAGTALQLAQLQYKERGARAQSTYDGFYPSLNSTFVLAPDVLLRGAYARTIGRPDITAIVPGVTITDISSNSADPVINENNTGLKPWQARNWDLSLETYHVKGAVASVSLFRKDVTNFFTSVQRPATTADLDRYGLGAEYAAYDILTTTNSADAAAIQGIELDWRQSLRPFGLVPEWARPLQVYFNFTHLTVSGPGADNFLPFRPHLLNWGVSYTQRRALVRVNVAQQGAQRTAALAANSTTPAGSYQYIAIRIITDVSFEYRLNRYLAFYGSARNLFQNPRRQFKAGPNTPEYARAIRYDYYGALLTAGIKGTF